MIKIILKSRSKAVLTSFLVLTVLCLVVGEITGKPYDLKNSTMMISFVAWFCVKVLRDRKFIKLPIFQRDKWKEPQFMAGLVPAFYPFIAWLFYLVFNYRLELSIDIQVMVGGIVSSLIALNRGKDKTKVPATRGKEN